MWHNSCPTNPEMPRHAGVFAAVAIAIGSAGATAEGEGQRSNPGERIASGDLRVLAHAGLFAGPALGITLGGTLEYRRGPIVGGALVETGAEILGYEFTGAALVGGAGLRFASSCRVDLLGEFGRHWYSRVDNEFLGPDPGASGSVLYAGARANVSYLFLEGPGHLEFGAFADFQDDLARNRYRYSYPGEPGPQYVHPLLRGVIVGFIVPRPVRRLAP